MKSYLEQVHKELDEKFTWKSSTGHHAFVMDDPHLVKHVKAFFDEKLKAFVEMKKEAILAEKVDELSLSERGIDALMYHYRGLNEGLDEALKVLESEEAEN